MELTGRSLVAGTPTQANSNTFCAVDPSNGKQLEPTFCESTEADIDQAFVRAEEAFVEYRNTGPEEKASFLEAVAEEVEALGSELIDRAGAETGLPEARLLGERGRTVGQLRLFAGVVREGSWVEARVDRAMPDRTPLPRPDIRRMLKPLGPCLVFGASNFPFAFSAAGGDSASALAAGCSVVHKAHPAHPGTSELVTRAFLRAVEKTGMPKGLFSMIHGVDPQVSVTAVTHPLAQAVAFTGSLKAGRALFDAAAARPVPIPVYAEMGSLNPMFVLPGALGEGCESFAKGFLGSLTLGVGQFCTNPGLVVAAEGEGLDRFKEILRNLVSESSPGTMLHSGIRQSYEDGVAALEACREARLVAKYEGPLDPERTEAGAAVFEVEAGEFIKGDRFADEIFGPASILVTCHSPEEMQAVASSLSGHLTAAVHGSENELVEASDLVAILERKAGRLLFNGFPTGVEVCPAMQHGGPYPATTDSRTTSVGTAAIERFCRPVAYQDFPPDALPAELRDKNETEILRLIDNEWTTGDA